MNFRTHAVLALCAFIASPALADDLASFHGQDEVRNEIRVVDTNDDGVVFELPDPVASTMDVATADGMTEELHGQSRAQTDRWIDDLATTARPGQTERGGDVETNNLVVPLPAPVAIAAIGLVGLVAGRKQLRKIAG